MLLVLLYVVTLIVLLLSYPLVRYIAHSVHITISFLLLLYEILLMGIYWYHDVSFVVISILFLLISCTLRLLEILQSKNNIQKDS